MEKEDKEALEQFEQEETDRLDRCYREFFKLYKKVYIIVRNYSYGNRLNQFEISVLNELEKKLFVFLDHVKHLEGIELYEIYGNELIVDLHISILHLVNNINRELHKKRPNKLYLLFNTISLKDKTERFNDVVYFAEYLRNKDTMEYKPFTYRMNKKNKKKNSK